VAVVHWHAQWVASSCDAADKLKKIAQAYPGLAALNIDVESSIGNRVFAMEKVMQRASAKREGAKPVLRTGLRWPCFTVHYAPILQPMRMMAGDGALKDLEQVAAQAGSVKSENSNSSGSMAALTDAGLPTADKSQVRVLQKGAAEFKSVLAEGKEKGEAVIAVWTSSVYSDSHAAMQAAAATAAGRAKNAVVILADVATCHSNKVLAEALHVRHLPALHVYRDMKLETKLHGQDATPDAIVHAACGGGSLSADTSATLLTNAPQKGHVGGAFDPPTGKYARPGAAQRMPDGRTGHFFPRMPCLRCGCPWWTSEDWNARCMRCGWD